jgi:putative tryptophan/tyrosine transport system substrate-binding protein
MAGKQVELLKTMVPNAKRIAVLVNPHDPTHAGRSAAVIAAARSMGVEAFPVAATVPEQIEGAFAEVTGRNADALIVLNTGLFGGVNTETVELAARDRLPALYMTTRRWRPAG